ncbi:SOS response-associated peptidase [Jatrophihabitans sp. YIM 134969]
MCGRYVSVRSDADLLREFEAEDATGDGAAQPEPTSYNVAPTMTVRAVVNRRRRDAEGAPVGEPVRQLRTMRWGLVPSWAKDLSVGARMINARVESVPEKPAFRKAFAARRALIPADGWYEWKRPGEGSGPKQPFYMVPRDGHPLAFAGLYEFWSDPADPDAPTLTTCTIVTAPSAGELAEIHDRMPLVLARDVWARWLDPAEKAPVDLLQPWDEAHGELLELRPVSARVNKVDHDDPSLLEPATVAGGAETSAEPTLF